MLLEQLEQDGLLFNVNFKESAGDGLTAYRGELVLVEGEVIDASGRRKPPVTVIRETVVLADAEQFRLVAGFLDEMADLSTFVERFGDRLGPDTQALFYVPNAHQAMQVEAGGGKVILIPLTDGMVWNELMEELALEKSDFKGQSSAEKVVTMAEGFDDYTPRHPTVALADALAQATDARREHRGPV